MEADEEVDERDWSKWRYKRTLPSARPTERKERVEVDARVVTYTTIVSPREQCNQNRAYRMGFPGRLHLSSAQKDRCTCPLVSLSQIPYFHNRRAHIIFVLDAPASQGWNEC